MLCVQKRHKSSVFVGNDIAVFIGVFLCVFFHCINNKQAIGNKVNVYFVADSCNSERNKNSRSAPRPSSDIGKSSSIVAG